MKEKLTDNHGVNSKILDMADELIDKSVKNDTPILVSIPVNGESDLGCIAAYNGDREELEDAILGAIVTFIEENDLNYMEMRDLKHDIDDLIDDEISSAKLRMLLDFGMSALDQYDDYDDDDLDKDFDDGNDDEGSDIKHHFNGFGAQSQKFCAEAPDFSRGEQSDGYDHWSSLETSDILQDDPQKSVILKALENNLSNEKLQKSAVRWYARGLTLEDAIRKVLVDEEVTHNAIHKKEKYNEENYYNLQSEF